MLVSRGAACAGHALLLRMALGLSELCAVEGLRRLGWSVACGRRSRGGYTDRRLLLVGVACVRSGFGRARGVCWLWALLGDACGDGGSVRCVAVGLARRCWRLY